MGNGDGWPKKGIEKPPSLLGYGGDGVIGGLLLKQKVDESGVGKYEYQ